MECTTQLGAAQGMHGPGADAQAAAQAQAQGQSALFEKLAAAAAAQNPGGAPGGAQPAVPKGAARTLDELEAALKGGTIALPQGGALHGFGPQPAGGANPGNALLSMLQANANMRGSPQPGQVMPLCILYHIYNL